MDRLPRYQGLSARARAFREREPLKKRDPESLWPILRFLRRATLKNVPKLTVLSFLWCETCSYLKGKTATFSVNWAGRVGNAKRAQCLSSSRRFFKQIEQKRQISQGLPS
jgi:hypothetical protein